MKVPHAKGIRVYKMTRYPLYLIWDRQRVSIEDKNQQSWLSGNARILRNHVHLLIPVLTLYLIWDPLTGLKSKTKNQQNWLSVNAILSRIHVDFS